MPSVEPLGMAGLPTFVVGRVTQVALRYGNRPLHSSLRDQVAKGGGVGVADVRLNFGAKRER